MLICNIIKLTILNNIRKGKMKKSKGIKKIFTIKNYETPYHIDFIELEIKR